MNLGLMQEALFSSIATLGFLESLKIKSNSHLVIEFKRQHISSLPLANAGHSTRLENCDSIPIRLLGSFR
jgi:hypothetical protein